MYFLHLNLNLLGDWKIRNMWTLRTFNCLLSDLFSFKLFTVIDNGLRVTPPVGNCNKMYNELKCYI